MTAAEEREECRKWRLKWPNTADFNFNYFRLLKAAEDAKHGIAEYVNKDTRIAIVGAGAAGLTAAYELYRCGFEHIHILEASQRLGGRTSSEPLLDAEGKIERNTVYELGAMRMPFFETPEEDKEGKDRNSVLAYYRDLFLIETIPFPNPGTCNTGIFVNNAKVECWGPNQRVPPSVEHVDAKWKAFKERYTIVARKHYGNDDMWKPFWQGVAAHYWDKSFRDIVRAPVEKNPKKHELGDFGGMAMTSEEADLFSVVGAGDGGWGAFYDVSALYLFRTLLAGFGQDLQLIVGKRRVGELGKGPEQLPNELHDSSGDQMIPRPAYLGVQTFAECLFFERVFGRNESLYEALQASRNKADKGVKLWLKTPVTRIEYTEGKRVRVHHRRAGKQEEVAGEPYDAVILTPTTWALQETVQSSGFENKLPEALKRARKSLNLSHWIASCKVFVPLKEQYWKTNAGIPQVLITDTFIRDAYGYAIDEHDPGVLLASYTWEDDSEKLICEKPEELAKRCLEKLDEIIREGGLCEKGIMPYIVENWEARSRVIQWRMERHYRGCAMLYRERSWDDNYALLSYNQRWSKETGLYLAGEAYSVEGGWLEPALRMALDAVIHIIKNFGGKFVGDADQFYPEYGLSWSPDPTTIAGRSEIGQ